MEKEKDKSAQEQNSEDDLNIDNIDISTLMPATEEGWDSSSSLKDLLDFAPLLVSIERQIVSILLVKGLVRLYTNTESVDDYTFDNIELTSKGRSLSFDELESRELNSLVSTLTSVNNKINLSKSLKSSVNLTDDEVEDYRKVFPVGARGPGAKIVRHRLEKFLTENSCTYEDIVNAAKLYIRHNSSKGYNIMQAHFFLYKRDQQSKVDESKAEEFLEQIRNSHVAKDWRDNVV